jgi:hypothetical protein
MKRKQVHAEINYVVPEAAELKLKLLTVRLNGLDM